MQVVSARRNLKENVELAKCAWLYIHKMQNIPKNVWLKEQFEKGCHGVRSGRFWAGLWSDLVNGQTSMKSLKTSGCFTRGREFAEDARHLLALSIGYTAAVHDAMNTLSGVSLGLKDQNIEIVAARKSRDDDCHRFYQWLEVRNPFNNEDGHLHSLSSGVVSIADKDPIDCENKRNHWG